jgi:hypothetical protein
MAWEQNLRAVLERYLTTESAIDAVLVMNRALYTLNETLTGRNDEAQRSAVVLMMIDHVVGLEANPFLIMHRHRIWPLYTAALNAYLDALTYVSEDADLSSVSGDARTDARIDLRSKAMGCKQVAHEIALAALLWEQGASTHRRKSREMRDALLNVKE